MQPCPVVRAATNASVPSLKISDSAALVGSINAQNILKTPLYVPVVNLAMSVYVRSSLSKAIVPPVLPFAAPNTKTKFAVCARTVNPPLTVYAIFLLNAGTVPNV